MTTLKSCMSTQNNEAQVDRYSRSVHLVDHLCRLGSRVRDQKRIARFRDDAKLGEMTLQLIDSLKRLATADFPIADTTERRIQQVNQGLKASMRNYRILILKLTAAGKMNTKTALARMDTARSLRRIAYHAWRIADHACAGPLKRSA